MERVHREKIQSGWKEDKRFEGEDRIGSLQRQKGAYNTVEVYKMERIKEEDTMLVVVRSPEEPGTQQGG